MPNHTIHMPRLHVGTVQATLGPLTLFPVWTQDPVPARRRYRLPERGRTGLVTEHPDRPRVEELLIDNPGGDPLLLLEGMTLDGGWQHRVLTRSMLAAPGQRTPIPVRCIEASRWHGSRAQRFSTYDAPLRMRATLRSFERSDHGAPGEPDQGLVWDRVATYETTAAAHSETNSLHDLQRSAATACARQLAAIRPLYGQRGVVVAALGHPFLAEITDHPDTLAERWDAILAGLALDAVGTPNQPTPHYRIRSFVRLIAHSPIDVAGRAGAGLAVQSDGRDVVSLRGIADVDGLLHAVVLNRRHELGLAA